jgi:hypothetical protein
MIAHCEKKNGEENACQRSFFFKSTSQGKRMTTEPKTVESVIADLAEAREAIQKWVQE